MPYETQWEPEGVRVTYSGTMTDDDIIRSNLEMYEDPRFDTIGYQIVDLRGVSKFGAKAQTVRTLARMDSDQSVRNPGVRVAILAKAALMQGLAQMYALSTGESPWETQVFDTEEDARAWLAG